MSSEFTLRVAHLATVDSTLRYLLLPQLESVVEAGGEAVGISAPGPDVGAIEHAGIRHVALQSSTRGFMPLNDLRSAWELWRILRAERFDVLHTHNPKPGLYGRIVGRLAGVPIVVNTVHGLYATREDRRMKRIVVYILEGLASRFSDAELVQSSEDLALLKRLRISSPKKTRLLGNGIDLARFDPDRFGEGDRRLVRDELGFGDGDVVVGMVGRLVEEKGFLELFEAASLLGPGYQVVAIGPADRVKSDALQESVLRQAEERGVRFLGLREDVDRLCSAMDIFVLPSHREGVPRAAMEAAAMGLPIVATDIRGCREVVRDGVNGILVPPKDATALAEAIRRLGEGPELRRSMGEAGRQIAVQRFDERAVVRTVLDTYRRLALTKSNRKGPPSNLGLSDEHPSEVAT